MQNTNTQKKGNYYKNFFYVSDTEKVSYKKNTDSVDVMITNKNSSSPNNGLRCFDMDYETFNKLFYGEYNSKYRFEKLPEITKSRIKDYIISNTLNLNKRLHVIDTPNEIEPDFSYTNLIQVHEYLQTHVIMEKRNSFTMKKFFGDKMNIFSGFSYVIDGSNSYEELEGVMNRKVIATGTNISAPLTRISDGCVKLGKELIMFDIHDYENFPVLPDFQVFNELLEYFVDPNLNTGITLQEKQKFLSMNDKDKSIMYMMLTGFTDSSTGKTYYILGSSASKIRAGGTFLFVEGKGPEYDWLENWKYIEEEIRPVCFDMTRENYIAEYKNNSNAVMLKFETGHVGMNLSSGLYTDQIAKKLRGDATKVNGLNVFVVKDIITECAGSVVTPDYTNPKEGMKPFTFKKTDSNKLENNCTDGTTLYGVSAQAIKLYSAGTIPEKFYKRFKSEYGLCNSVEDVLKNNWLCWFIKKYIISTQDRFKRGVKGMAIPVLNIDFDPVCKALGVDIITFESSVKYLAEDTQPQILNFAHSFEPEKKRDRTNYQYLQASNITGEQLIHGASLAFEKVKRVKNSSADAQQFISGIRSIAKDTGDDLMTKLADDIEAEPNLIHDVYHHNKIMEKLQKYVDELATGKIPVDGQFMHITVDPVFCYHKAMIELTEKAINKFPERKEEFEQLLETHKAFQSSLNKGEVYCAGYTGIAGMWRSPMIHKSESQRVNVVECEYLWMYDNLVIFTPYDVIAPALSGADFDGDKVLFVLRKEVGSFERELVDSIAMPGWIVIDDETMKAKKVPNNILERAFTYSQVCKPARVGQITNWASTWTDIQHCTKSPFIERILLRMRYAQGLAIDYAKKGVDEKGPEGDLFPEDYLVPHFLPQWLYNLSIVNGRPMNYEKHLPEFIFNDKKMGWSINPDGVAPQVLRTYEKTSENGNVYKMVVIDKRYHGNSPMTQLNEWVNNEWAKLRADETHCYKMLELFRAPLSESERTAFETIKDEVIRLEGLYRNNSRIIALAFKDGLLSDDERKDRFEALTESMERSLMSLIKGDVTMNTVAYACYYSAYVRKNKDGSDEKVTGTCSFPWVCFHTGMINLLYQNNHSMILYALPNTEIESIEVLNGELFVNEKSKGMVNLKDGEYQPTVIDGKPYLYVRKDVPEKTVETVVSTFEGILKFGRFASENQKLVASELKDVFESNNNIFDVVVLNGQYRIAINGVSYATFDECPSELVNKRVELKEILTPLTFVSKRDGKVYPSKYMQVRVASVSSEVTPITYNAPTVSEERDFYENPFNPEDFDNIVLL